MRFRIGGGIGFGDNDRGMFDRDDDFGHRRGFGYGDHHRHRDSMFDDDDNDGIGGHIGGSFSVGDDGYDRRYRNYNYGGYPNGYYSKNSIAVWVFIGIFVLIFAFIGFIAYKAISSGNDANKNVNRIEQSHSSSKYSTDNFASNQNGPQVKSLEESLNTTINNPSKANISLCLDNIIAFNKDNKSNPVTVEFQEVLVNGNNTSTNSSSSTNEAEILNIKNSLKDDCNYSISVDKNNDNISKVTIENQ